MKIGEIVEGKYEILREIGKGGMSKVYLAMDNKLKKMWAIKEVNKLGEDKLTKINLASIKKEADLMKKLEHPLLPRITDVIETETTILIIMDYVDGQSLGRILKEHGPQDQYLVIDWAKQICEVFSYLHSLNPPVIYRDMKPNNVMLKPNGTIRVLDFGIAREYKEGNAEDTTLLGTRGYAAPEQFRENKRQTDARTDIYTLGSTMYTLLTGENPETNTPIRQINPKFLEGLEKIILKARSFKMADRYSTADEMYWDLDHVVEIGRPYRRKLKRKLAAFIIAAGVCVLAGLFGISAFALRSQEIKNNYNTLIGGNTLDDYYKAANTDPSRQEAYEKMVDYYWSEKIISHDEERELWNSYHNNDFLDVESDEYSEMSYQIGLAVTGLYETENSSLKERLKESGKYFVNVKNENSANYPAAQCFLLIEKYLTHGDQGHYDDLTKNSYDDFINNSKKCINTLVNTSDAEKINYIKSVVFKGITDYVYDNYTQMEEFNVEQNMITSLLELIKKENDKIIVDENHAAYKDKQWISSNIDEYISNIRNYYSAQSKEEDK